MSGVSLRCDLFSQLVDENGLANGKRDRSCTAIFWTVLTPTWSTVAIKSDNHLGAHHEHRNSTADLYQYRVFIARIWKCSSI